MKRKKAYELATALESGTYRKGKSALRPTSTTYCCLGVTCRLAGKKFKNAGTGKKPDYAVHYRDSDGDSRTANSVLPDDVQAEFGFQSNDGTFQNGPIKIGDWNYGSLVDMNDGVPELALPFSVIAKTIRKHYKQL